MEASDSLLFILSTLGVLNGILLSIYLFYTSIKYSQNKNKFLSLLLFIISIRVGKSVIFFFFEDTVFINLYLQIGLSACFLIGPCLYFYICSFFKKPLLVKWWIQLLVLSSIIFITSSLYPYFEYIEKWRNLFIPIIYLEWFIYLLFSAYIIWKNINSITVNNHKILNKKTWIISIFIGVFIIWLMYVTCGLGSYLLGAVSFSFMVYLLLFLLLMGSNKSHILDEDTPKYGGRKIKSSDQNNIYIKLESELEKKYSDPNLTLETLSKSIDVPTYLISQILNEHYQTNFANFLKTFRVNKVKELILSNNQYTIDAIGEECGFRAKSTFYTSFKQITGMTPTQFKKNKHKNSSDLEN